MGRRILGLMLVFASSVVQSIGGSSELLGRHHRSVNDPRLTADEAKQVLSVHNYVRTLEGSSDMQTLRWNSILARLAEDWAKRCSWEHGHTTESRNGLGYKYVGQNLYYISGVNSINLTSATMDWYNEKPFYAYDSSTCQSNEVCGHYTQIVWADTYEIGCAYIQCPILHKTTAKNAFYYVCNYGPGGNYVGQKPFLKGSGCTKCSTGKFWCTQDLCNRECSSSGRNCECSPPCKNGASVIRSNCSCQCAAGWTGVDCSKLCKNYHSNCDPAPGRSGWPPSWCKDHDYVRQYCPLMCKMCKYSKDAIEMSVSTSTTVSTGNQLRVLMSTATMHSSWIAFILFYMLSDRC